jgi:hypothetical protein
MMCKVLSQFHSILGAQAENQNCCSAEDVVTSITLVTS